MPQTHRCCWLWWFVTVAVLAPLVESRRNVVVLPCDDQTRETLVNDTLYIANCPSLVATSSLLSVEDIRTELTCAHDATVSNVEVYSDGLPVSITGCTGHWDDVTITLRNFVVAGTISYEAHATVVDVPIVTARNTVIVVVNITMPLVLTSSSGAQASEQRRIARLVAVGESSNVSVVVHDCRIATFATGVMIFSAIRMSDVRVDVRRSWIFTDALTAVHISWPHTHLENVTVAVEDVVAHGRLLHIDSRNGNAAVRLAVFLVNCTVLSRSTSGPPIDVGAAGDIFASTFYIVNLSVISDGVGSSAAVVRFTAESAFRTLVNSSLFVGHVTAHVNVTTPGGPAGSRWHAVAVPRLQGSSIELDDVAVTFHAASSLSFGVAVTAVVRSSTVAMRGVALLVLCEHSTLSSVVVLTVPSSADGTAVDVDNVSVIITARGVTGEISGAAANIVQNSQIAVRGATLRVTLTADGARIGPENTSTATSPLRVVWFSLVALLVNATLVVDAPHVLLAPRDDGGSTTTVWCSLQVAPMVAATVLQTNTALDSILQVKVPRNWRMQWCGRTMWNTSAAMFSVVGSWVNVTAVTTGSLGSDANCRELENLMPAVSLLTCAGAACALEKSQLAAEAGVWLAAIVGSSSATTKLLNTNILLSWAVLLPATGLSMFQSRLELRAVAITMAESKLVGPLGAALFAAPLTAAPPQSLHDVTVRSVCSRRFVSAAAPDGNLCDGDTTLIVRDIAPTAVENVTVVISRAQHQRCKSFAASTTNSASVIDTASGDTGTIPSGRHTSSLSSVASSASTSHPSASLSLSGTHTMVIRSDKRLPVSMLVLMASRAGDGAAAAVVAANLWSVVLGGGAGGVVSLDAVAMATLNLVSCRNADSGQQSTAGENLSRILISPFADLGSLAMALGNVGIVLVVAAAQMLLLTVRLRGASDAARLAESTAAASCRYPYITLQVSLFLMNGVVVGVTRLLMEPDALWYVKALCLVVVLVVTIAFCLLWRRSVCWVLAHATYHPLMATRKTAGCVVLPQWFVWLTTPQGEWQPQSAVTRFGVAFQSSRSSAHVLWVTLSLVQSAVCAFVAALTPLTCVVQYSLLALLSAGMSIGIALRRPYRVASVTLLTMLSFCCVACQALVLTIANSSSDAISLASADAICAVLQFIGFACVLLKLLNSAVLFVLRRLEKRPNQAMHHDVSSQRTRPRKHIGCASFASSEDTNSCAKTPWWTALRKIACLSPPAALRSSETPATFFVEDDAVQQKIAFEPDLDRAQHARKALKIGSFDIGQSQSTATTLLVLVKLICATRDCVLETRT